MDCGNGISMLRLFFDNDFLWLSDRILIIFVEKTAELLVFFNRSKAIFRTFSRKNQKISIITTFLIEFSCKAYFAVYSNDCSI
jgi:hypothetical protein